MKCLAQGKTPDQLDELARMARAVVRMGDDHPWKRTLARARTEPRDLPRGDRAFARLARGLVRFGGAGVVYLGPEPDLDELFARGQLWPGTRAEHVPGRESQCHRNSSLYWARNMGSALIATGYALSEDGLWHQHSWCIDVGADGTPRIIESTVPRVAYFGFVMTAEESAEFHLGNVGRERRLPAPRRASGRGRPQPAGYAPAFA